MTVSERMSFFMFFDSDYVDSRLRSLLSTLPANPDTDLNRNPGRRQSGVRKSEHNPGQGSRCAYC
jgi:hypothetical protein